MTIVEEIYEEWAEEYGALYKVKFEEFDHHACHRLLNKLARIDFEDHAEVSHDLVSVIWDIPYFFDIHSAHIKRRMPEHAGPIDRVKEAFQTELTRIFDFRPSFIECTGAVVIRSK